MKKVIERVDAFLLKYFTKFAHRFQQITGRTNYFLAKIGLIVVLAALSIAIMSSVLPILSSKTPPVFAFIMGLIAIAEISRMTMLDEAEKYTLESSTRAKYFIPANDIHIRFMWLIFSVKDILTLIFSNSPATIWRVILYSASAGLLIYYYFLAVDPLPPGKSKVKEFFEAIASYLSPAKTVENEAQR